MKKLDYREIGNGQLRVEIKEFRGTQRIKILRIGYSAFTLDELEQIVIDLISIRNEMARNQDEAKNDDGDE